MTPLLIEVGPVRAGVLLGVLVLAGASMAQAADQLISAEKLVLRWDGGSGGRLVFVSKDPGFPFPPIGSFDDPGTGTLGGFTIELFPAATAPIGSGFIIPVGEGTPGWTSHDGTVDVHRYSNPLAPAGPVAVRSVLLKEGRSVKVMARAVPFAPPGVPLGRVGVRITTGSLRSCTIFEADAIRRDDPSRFVAKKTPAPAIPDCDQMTLQPYTTTTTLPPYQLCAGGSPYPTCDGACDAGDVCGRHVDLSQGFVQACACFPADVTPCTDSTYPACGGACLGGTVCQALWFDDGSGITTFCACVDPMRTCGPPPPSTCGGAGVCPPGLACAGIASPPYCDCTTP